MSKNAKRQLKALKDRWISEEYAYLDKVEQVHELIQRWHDGEGGELPLNEWLGMSLEQYGEFIKGDGFLPDSYTIPNLSNIN